MDDIDNKADEEYWNNVWNKQNIISKIDINCYKKVMVHDLYKNYFKADESKSICEIGCAMSQNLLYFHDYFKYKINGFDYEEKSVIKTKSIYETMGYQSNIFHHDLFSTQVHSQYDIISSFGVFEHFTNLTDSIKYTNLYLKENGMILTVIPNMNGIVGLMQKYLNRKVYDIHIPYKKDEIKVAHEVNGYKTLFCDYFGTYVGGVVNIDDIKYSNIISRIISIPGRPLYYLNKLVYKVLNKRLDSVYNSPYIIYIGRLKK